LVDAGASLPVLLSPGTENELHRCFVAGRLTGVFAPYRLEDLVVLSKSHRAPSPEERSVRMRLPILARRAEIVGVVRDFFRGRGFLEAETPARVVCPGMEVHLVPFPAGRDRWLATSPELALKRLVAAGAEKVFEVARAFRDDERSPWHLSEFTLLEWYRAYAEVDALVEDVHALLLQTARAARSGESALRLGECDLSKPPERLTVRDAFVRYAEIDLAAVRERHLLADALTSLGIPYDADDEWDDLFHRLFIDRVEEHLGRSSITILEEYPASQAALARIRHDEKWPVALRFEVYVAGVELANAFDELCDEQEQRRRFERDRAERMARGGPEISLDEAFLDALCGGLPPCVGIALGLDRLIALLLDLPGGARDTVPFPDLV